MKKRPHDFEFHVENPQMLILANQTIGNGKYSFLSFYPTFIVDYLMVENVIYIYIYMCVCVCVLKY